MNSSIAIKRRRKLMTVAMVSLLVLFGLVYGFTYPNSALAWDNCPNGLVNDPYPGQCGRYQDTNGDGICDLSQAEPVATTTTTAPPSTTTTKQTASTTTTLATATVTSGDPPTDGCPLGPCTTCGACAGIAAAASASTTTTLPGTGSSDPMVTVAASGTAGNSNSSDAGDSSFLTHYMVSPIAIGFLVIYGTSVVLYKTKRIRLATHRKIWNVLLAATFLVTGIFGLILAIQLDYELPFKIPINLLYWHVEAGIVMTLISFFHLGWHFNYYRNLLRSSRKKVRATEAANETAPRTGKRAMAPTTGELAVEVSETDLPRGR